MNHEEELGAQGKSWDKQIADNLLVVEDLNNHLNDAASQITVLRSQNAQLTIDLAACRAGSGHVPTFATKFGSCIGAAKGETNQAAVKRINTLFGDVKVLRVFDGGKGPAPWGTYGEDLVTDDVAVIMSCKASPQDILLGKLDSKFVARWQSVPKNRRAKVKDCLWHEPEDNIQGGEYTEAQWEAAQVYLNALLKRTLGNQEYLELITIIMSWTLEDAANRDEDLYVIPGFKTLGIDLYNERWDLVEAYAIKNGFTDIVIAEFGWIRKTRPSDDEMVAYFNRYMPLWKASKVPISLISYFNGGKGTQYEGAMLDDRPKAAALWKTYCDN